MTFKERLDREKDNLTKIVLYNDRGLFFNLVERSAYAFCTRIKKSKAQVKSVKNIPFPFISIGVLRDKKDEYLQGLDVNTDDNGNVTALLKEPIDENAFQAWKKYIIEQDKGKDADKTAQHTIPADTAHNDASDVRNDDNDTILRQCLQEVKALNIASMTPMEAMLYLNSLQQKLKDVNI